MLSGPIEEVLAQLEAWDVVIQRDDLTGEVTHPAVVHVVDREGRLAFVTTGGGRHGADLVARLD